MAAFLCATLMVCGCRDDHPSGPVNPPDPNSGSIAIVFPLSTPMTSAGETRTAIGVVLDANQTPVTPTPTISWTSGSPSVATVNSTGAIATITAVGDGATTIRATSGSAKGSITVTVHRAATSAAGSTP
ncbi:MAG TPA: Ig-like domain-containing protein [Gemmatimonadaceae bacterium]|nr:Ig-like domain-containing protein [Gemmatimonadaceae bacterium]